MKLPFLRERLAEKLVSSPLRGMGLVDSESMVSYLVDPASSHMLVSKIKPCMSKYKLLIL